MSDSSGPKCPVCKGHSKREALESQGIVLSAVEAFIKRDDAAITAISAAMNDYDAHAAVSLYALAYLDLSRVVGVDPLTMIDQERRHINGKLAALSE